MKKTKQSVTTESVESQNIDSGKRTMINAAWVTPVIASAILPAHAQSSLALSCSNMFTDTSGGGPLFPSSSTVTVTPPIAGVPITVTFLPDSTATATVTTDANGMIVGNANRAPGSSIEFGVDNNSNVTPCVATLPNLT